MKKQLKKELSKRGLTELPYQIDFLTNPIYQVDPKVVLAAGTSAGKTIMMALWLELNQPPKALVIPASKTILRDNVAVEFAKFKPTFTYSIVTNKKELQKAISDKVQVIVALPQTLNKNYHLLPKMDSFILDEAHQWYFKTTIQNIVKHIKPKHQLLLTGSPSKFVADGNFTFKFVPVMELYDLGHVTNVKIEVVSSSYDFKQTDYLSAYGSLKSTKTNSPTKAKQALEMVVDEMLLKLQSDVNHRLLKNVKAANKFSKLFNHLKKTIIYTHSKKQADTFHKILNQKMNGQVLLSHSENDGKSEMFEQFQNDTNIKVLVAVDRGRLGFNMPELFNIVDFTMTQSLDMLLQMYGRLLRKSVDRPNDSKVYFKVATKNTADYFVDLMTAMGCLLHLDWYSKYNGKNMGGIRIPKVLMSNRKRVKANNPSQTSSTQRQTKPYVSLAELGIPIDLNFFRQSILHTSDGIFDTVAWTTLDDIRREFFDITGKNQFSTFRPFQEARKFARSLNFTSKSEWVDFTNEKDFPNDIPKVPEKCESYTKHWKSYKDWLGTEKEIITNSERNKRFYDYQMAKEYMITQKLNSESDFRQWRLNKPDFIPSNPERTYKGKGWVSFSEFLKDETAVSNFREFRPYKQTKKYIQSLGITTSKEWTEYVENNELPIDIPKTLQHVYKKEWEGWPKFLNSKNARQYAIDKKTGKKFLIK